MLFIILLTLIVLKSFQQAMVPTKSGNGCTFYPGMIKKTCLFGPIRSLINIFSSSKYAKLIYKVFNYQGFLRAKFFEKIWTEKQDI